MSDDDDYTPEDFDRIIALANKMGAAFQGKPIWLVVGALTVNLMHCLHEFGYDGESIERICGWIKQGAIDGQMAGLPVRGGVRGRAAN